MNNANYEAPKFQMKPHFTIKTLYEIQARSIPGCHFIIQWIVAEEKKRQLATS